MAERRYVESIYRTIHLPNETPSSTSAVGTIRLRHILAEDGCKESQVSLAKSLLSAPSSCPEESTYNAQLAVHWLLQAVQTGQEEAFLLLKHCANTGVGINAVNQSEVAKYLKFTEKERVSRKIAFSLFRAIMSDSEELIPSDVFRERVDLIFEEKIFDNLPSDIPEKLCQKTKVDEVCLQDQKHVTFSDVVGSIQSCLEGNVPLVSIKPVTHYSEYKKWISMKKFFIFCDLVLQSLEKLFRDISTLNFPLSIILMILLIELSGNFFLTGSGTNILLKKFKFLLIGLFSLVVMLSCSSYIININFGGDNLKRWLHLINIFEPNIKSNEIEMKYLSKTLVPLLIFFFSSFIYIALLLENQISVDIGIMCFILMIFVDRTITYQRYFVNISLLVNILTCLYKANMIKESFNSVISYLDIKVVYELTENFNVHIGFISCLALPFLLPYLYFKISLGKRFWHFVLLPHLMSLLWMNLACFHLSKVHSTQYIFSILSWLFILILSHYTGFLFTFYLYLVMNISRTNSYLNSDFLIFVLVVVVLYLICSIIMKNFKIYENKKISIFLIFTMLFLLYKTLKPLPFYNESDSNIILWEKYQTYCHHKAWYQTNTAEVQISCLPLKGRKVDLEGTVTSLEMVHNQNYLQIFATMLPEPLYSFFVCTVGENYQFCEKNNLNSFEKDRCKMYESLNIASCHLHNWDTYNYKIVVEVLSRISPEVMVVTDHSCSSFVKNLKEGDSIQVIGILDQNIGSSHPVLILDKARCTNCYNNSECNIVLSEGMVMEYKFSLKNIIWLFMSPFIQYKTN